jgi:hypothetical protein
LLQKGFLLNNFRKNILWTKLNVNREKQEFKIIYYQLETHSLERHLLERHLLESHLLEKLTKYLKTSIFLLSIKLNNFKFDF